MQTLVMAILALVVLVILIFIFRTQIGNTMEKYTKIADESEKAIEGEICGAWLSDTKCISDKECSKELGDDWQLEPGLACTNPSQPTCCKKI